jgi:hypothetical protein
MEEGSGQLPCHFDCIGRYRSQQSRANANVLRLFTPAQWPAKAEGLSYRQLRLFSVVMGNMRGREEKNEIQI